MKLQDTIAVSPQSEHVDGSRPSLVFCGGKTNGWGPIEHLVQLMAQMLELGLQQPAMPRVSRLRSMRLISRPILRDIGGTSSNAGPGAIYVAKSPGAIKALTQLKNFDEPQRFRALWIVDSFWTEWSPSAHLMRQFDLIIYMQKGEADFYERLAPGRTLYLGWGADVLDLGSDNPNRQVDVQRVGRQPDAWDDDIQSQRVCQEAGLTFAGRPPYTDPVPGDPSAEHRALCTHYANAKFVVAHSNLAAPASYTHPTKEYLTGRWTDALAGGAMVAGVQPFGDASAEDLLWTGATLDFDRIDLAHNVEALSEANDLWVPEIARHNFLQALRKLDWRWRIKSMADRLELHTPTLEAELARLRARITALQP